VGVEVLLVDSSVVARTAVVPLSCLIGSSGRLISVDFEWSSLCGFDLSEMALRQEVKYSVASRRKNRARRIGTYLVEGIGSHTNRPMCVMM
jgi:hypothetical protein